MSFQTGYSGEFLVAHGTCRIFTIVSTFMKCQVEFNIKWHRTLVTSVRLFVKTTKIKTEFNPRISYIYPRWHIQPYKSKCLKLKKEQFKYLHMIMILNNTSLNYSLFFVSHYWKCKYSISRAYGEKRQRN